jgi:hypothetical protein
MSLWTKIKQSRKRGGTIPGGYKDTVLYPNQVAWAPGYQEKQNWQYPPAPAHEQRSALINAWQGNQLPGPTNFIPGVALSRFTWNVPTSYANTLKNQQYNVGFNIQGYGSVQNAALQQAIQQAWQNRVQGV